MDEGKAMNHLDGERGRQRGLCIEPDHARACERKAWANALAGGEQAIPNRLRKVGRGWLLARPGARKISLESLRKVEIKFHLA